ncbi:N-methyl-L-tryptophan oxidase [soil metagenome]
MAARRSAVVVGAGVFGASLAYTLVWRDWDVTLVEARAPGHARASSGGESRLLRYAHGADRWHTRLAWRARTLWRELEQRTGTELFVPAGTAWFAHRHDGWEADSEATMAAERIPVRRLGTAEAAALFPDLATGDLSFVLFEPEGGVLRAAAAVRALVDATLSAGGRLVPGEARPDGAAVDVDGRGLRADRVVWACGPWLPRLFPGLVDLRVTKQDVLFFGAPPAWRTPPVPTWVDYDGAAYGLGDLDGHGVKACPDVEGEEFDPEDGRRELSPVNERRARDYLRLRFPSLADAPLLGARTCQYTLTADTHFVVAPHPHDPSVWLLGGGSGHGFKHGPALGEYVAELLAGEREPDPRFALGHRDRGAGLRTAGGVT